MVATKNIDILGPIWTFSLRDVLTFVTSGLDVNGCVLSYFEGTANLHCYTSCIFIFFETGLGIYIYVLNCSFHSSLGVYQL